MSINRKFMKLLMKRMRRACGITNDKLEVSYYMSNSVITILVYADSYTRELEASKQFSSLEAFIAALILEEKEVTA